MTDNKSKESGLRLSVWPSRVLVPSPAEVGNLWTKICTLKTASMLKKIDPNIAQSFEVHWPTSDCLISIAL